MMKVCIDPNHEGPNNLPLTGFYRHPRHSDGRGSYCIPCHIRRAKKIVYRARDARQAAGLSRTNYKPKAAQRKLVESDLNWLQMNRPEAA